MVVGKAGSWISPQSWPGLTGMVGRAGIYILNANAKPNARIEFFDFATNETTPILRLEKPATTFAYAGLAIAPDGRSLLYSQNELDDSYIMLVKNFR
jgi:hypothetical protein